MASWDFLFARAEFRGYAKSHGRRSQYRDGRALSMKATVAPWAVLQELDKAVSALLAEMMKVNCSSETCRSLPAAA